MKRRNISHIIIIASSLIISLSVIAAMMIARNRSAANYRSSLIDCPTNTSSGNPMCVQVKFGVDKDVSFKLNHLFGKWLEQYMSTETSDMYRIEDYKIDEIDLSPELRRDVPEEFRSFDVIAKVYYSVKPSIKPSLIPLDSPSYWMAGDGIVKEEDPWVRRKVTYLSIKVIGDVYEIHIFGPCPTC